MSPDDAFVFLEYYFALVTAGMRFEKTWVSKKSWLLRGDLAIWCNSAKLALGVYKVASPG